MTRLFLVRHGETEWSASGQHTGRTDVALTDAGRAQAGLLAARLQGPFALVLTSPLARAVDTCRLAGFSGTVDPDLAEWDYGDYEGLTSVEIRAERPGWWMWTDGCPNGESPWEVAARADRVIARCGEVDGDVALFAHGHILRVVGARWCGEPPQIGAVLSLDTASVSVLGWEHDRPVVTRWNA